MVVVALVLVVELLPLRVVNGELVEDLRETEGEVVVDFRKLLRLWSTTRSGEGSKTKSATLGDSVSL